MINPYLHISAWGVDDSMLDIEMPNTNTTAVETPSTTPAEIEPTTALEPTPVQISTPEQETAPTNTDPTPVVADAPKEEPVVEHQTSSPEPTNESSPPTTDVATQPSGTKTKESRPAKGRKPDAGSAKKKATKKPEVAKVELNFDFDDE